METVTKIAQQKLINRMQLKVEDLTKLMDAGIDAFSKASATGKRKGAVFTWRHKKFKCEITNMRYIVSFMDDGKWVDFCCRWH